MDKKTLICVVGRTCAGKSEIAKAFANRYGLKLVKSYTTRAPRPEEVENGLENSDHIFISDSDFDRLTTVAFVQIGKIRYGTTLDILMASDLYVIDPVGVQNLKENVGDRIRLVECYVMADRETRRRRFLKRGNTESDFRKREEDEAKLFAPYEEQGGYTFLVYNDGSLEDAVGGLEEKILPLLPEQN